MRLGAADKKQKKWTRVKQGEDEPGGHEGAGGKGSSPGAWIQNFGTWSEETRGGLDSRSWLENPTKAFPAFPLLDSLTLVASFPSNPHILSATRRSAGGAGGREPYQVNKMFQPKKFRLFTKNKMTVVTLIFL